MTASNVEDSADTVAVGRAIRLRRRQLHITMVALGQQAGISQSFLSEIEAGKRTPSLSTLFAIAEQLGTSPAALLQPDTTGDAVVVVRAGQGEEYQISDTPDGGHFRLMVRMGTLSAYEFVAAAGDDLSGDFQHNGHEFLYVVSGALRVVVHGQDPVLLGVGDAMAYPGTRPHSWEVVGDEDVKVIQVLDVPDAPRDIHPLHN